MKLSDRLAAATELTGELREEFARLCGWVPNDNRSLWWRDNSDGTSRGRWMLPEFHLGQIIDEIERRGWVSCHDTSLHQPIFSIYGMPGEYSKEATRADRNLQLCAMTALAKALEG